MRHKVSIKVDRAITHTREVDLVINDTVVGIIFPGRLPLGHTYTVEELIPVEPEDVGTVVRVGNCSFERIYVNNDNRWRSYASGARYSWQGVVDLAGKENPILVADWKAL